MISSGCRILGLALICHALAGPLFAQPPPPTAITVVSDDNYPPYIFRDAHGELRGILPDQWTLWEKKTGVKVILKAMDWAEAQRLMREGLADVIDTMFRTPEREQLFAFTPPYAEIRVPIFHHRELGGIADAGIATGKEGAKLAGKAVGAVVRGIFSGNPDQIDREMEAEGKKIEAHAMKICDHLPGLYKAQQDLAAALPAFQPYAGMELDDIAECRASQDEHREAGQEIGRSIGQAVKATQGDAAQKADAAAAEPAPAPTP